MRRCPKNSNFFFRLPNFLDNQKKNKKKTSPTQSGKRRPRMPPTHPNIISKSTTPEIRFPAFWGRKEHLKLDVACVLEAY